MNKMSMINEVNMASEMEKMSMINEVNMASEMDKIEVENKTCEKIKMSAKNDLEKGNEVEKRIGLIEKRALDVNNEGEKGNEGEKRDGLLEERCMVLGNGGKKEEERCMVMRGGRRGRSGGWSRNGGDPVKVRFRRLKSGGRSVYLDYRLGDGRRKTEYLRMYLLAGRSESVRRMNEHTMRAVANIKAQRLTNLAWNKEANEGVELSRLRLVDVIDEFAELRMRKGAKSSGRRYGSLKRRIGGLDGNVRVGEVDADFVERFAESLMRSRSSSGKALAKGTVIGLLTSLGSVMKYAARKGMARANPVAFYNMRNVKGRTERRTYLIAEELQRLVETPCRDEGVKRLFLFGCFVGLRFGDLMTLRWSEIVEEDGLSRIEKMMSKTKRMVYVPLNKTAMKYLPERKEDGLVFEGMKSSVGRIDGVLKAWAKDAGIEKNVTFYSARHTFATLSLTQGADLFSVSQLLGHKSIATTEGYAEIIDLKREEAMMKIDNLFGKFLSNKRLRSNEPVRTTTR